MLGPALISLGYPKGCLQSSAPGTSPKPPLVCTRVVHTHRWRVAMAAAELGSSLGSSHARVLGVCIGCEQRKDHFANRGTRVGHVGPCVCARALLSCVPLVLEEACWDEQRSSGLLEKSGNCLGGHRLQMKGQKDPTRQAHLSPSARPRLTLLWSFAGRRSKRSRYK